MLEFINVSGTGKGFCLNNISFCAKEGFITGITGANGAGKTTLLRYIFEENIPYEGTIRFRGTDIRSIHDSFRDKSGYISDDRRFFEELSALENARLLSDFYSNWDEKIFTSQMNEMNVSTGKMLAHLSRGEYIRFQLAFAMAHKSELYLLDEVTAGMDPVFRRDFYKFLHNLIATQNVTIIMTTHIEEEIRSHMDYTGVLQDGKLISFGEVGIS